MLLISFIIVRSAGWKYGYHVAERGRAEPIFLIVEAERIYERKKNEI